MDLTGKIRPVITTLETDVAALEALTTGALAPTSIAATTGMSIGGASTGTADATLTVNKTAAGAGGVTGQTAAVKRFELLMDASENLILRNYADDGTTVLGSLTFHNSTGLLTSLLGMVITAGGLTVSAGNIAATLGDISAPAGNISAVLGSVTALHLISTGLATVALTSYVDDAAAGVGGLTTNQLYKVTGTGVVMAKT